MTILLQTLNFTSRIFFLDKDTAMCEKVYLLTIAGSKMLKTM